MQRVLMIAVPTVAAVAVIGVASLMMVTQAIPQPDSPRTCLASLGPGASGGSGSGDLSTLGEQQREVAQSIIEIGQENNLPPRAWQIAIQAGMTESGLRNVSHGDRDSLGVFQMRPSMGWGSPSELTDVEYSITKFYDVLRGVPGWQQMRPGRAAQAVERSAFPARYHEWESMAAQLVEQAGEVENASGCGSESASGDETAQTAIEAAKSQRGVPYAWGGGGVDGPSEGIPPDEGVTGFDCSSLTMYAYAQAGITIPRLAAAQYDAGTHVPLKEAKPGDLVFWATTPDNPSTIHHVAIYLGHNKVINAPHSGSVVQVSEIWDDGLVPTVTRPGARSA